MSDLLLPSGRMFDDKQLTVIRMMHEHGTVRYSETSFNLKAGGTSHVYFNGRDDLTLNPGFLVAIAFSALTHLDANVEGGGGKVCLIGVPSAGTAIASAMCVYCEIEEERGEVSLLIMRQVRKTHGAHYTWVDGRPPADAIVVLVENVRTTGGSEEEALNRLKEDGIPTKDVVRLSIVDRKLRPETTTLKTVFYMADIITAFGYLGLWPQERVEACLPEFLQTS